MALLVGRSTLRRPVGLVGRTPYLELPGSTLRLRSPPAILMNSTLSEGFLAIRQKPPAAMRWSRAMLVVRGCEVGGLGSQSPALTLSPMRMRLQQWVTKRKADLCRLLARYRTMHRARPLAMAFCVCCTKGLVADTLAQKAIERRERLDRGRLIAMGLFSGSFTGCAYHLIFNRVFVRLFGMTSAPAQVPAVAPVVAAAAGMRGARDAGPSRGRRLLEAYWGQRLAAVTKKTAADAAVVFPFLYMPTFYMFDEGFRMGTLCGLPARWHTEILPTMKEYVKIWPPAMFFIFAMVPADLCVSAIAGVSFLWLVILSIISH